MINKKLALLIFVLLLIDISCKRVQDNEMRNEITNSKPLTVLQIISYARSHWEDDEPKYSSSKVCNDFDFCSLTPVESSKTNEYQIKIYYNDRKEIVKVLKSSDLEDNDFEFHVIHNSEFDYSILFVREFYDYSEMESEFIEGFFFVYKKHCYFVSFDSYPFCVMGLDSQLKVVSTLKFYSNKLTYKTKANYKNKDHLYSETFFKPKSNFVIGKNTLFTDLADQISLDINFTLDKERKLGLVQDLDHLPLWVFAGHQEYDVLSAP